MQGGREPGAFGRCPGEIGKLQLHEDFCDAAVGFFLGEIGHEFLKKFGHSLIALLERFQIAHESLFRAERFAWPIRFDRPMLPAEIDEVRIRRLSLGEGSVDVLLRRYPDGVGVNVLQRTGGVRVVVLK